MHPALFSMRIASSMRSCPNQNKCGQSKLAMPSHAISTHHSVTSEGLLVTSYRSLDSDRDRIDGDSGQYRGGESTVPEAGLP